MSESEEDGRGRQRTPPLYLDMPSKTEEAKSTFQEISSCTYGNKLLGDSGQNESMTCDCHENWHPVTKENLACGEDSGCINRATSVECVNNACNCGDNCQNQRFQRKQYAPVTVFQTEKKGYGLRADQIISEGSFIYEYIGEIIDETAFRKRMVDYDTKKFKHFYFMMLKKDSFIDATTKGSLARFVNHSCRPNAYVDKWVVGDKLRMGIFAKRAIQKGEEITFDYNVDRYGAQSQPCYCGEPNCMKVMGGKTQTDAALLLPEGISEALGVTLKQEKQWLKENKHLRSKQQKDDAIINEQFVKSIEVSALNDYDVPRVMAALMKTQDVHINKKLIERIYLTDDDNINLCIVKIHGYKTLSTLLKTYKDDNDMAIMILKILMKWPKITRNKISSSQIEDVVKDLKANSKNREIKQLSNHLLEEWGKLQMAYRIPKKLGTSSGYERSFRSHSPESHEKVKQELPDLPDGWESAIDPNTQNTYYFHRELGKSTWERPVANNVNGNGNGNGIKHEPASQDGSYSRTPRTPKSDGSTPNLQSQGTPNQFYKIQEITNGSNVPRGPKVSPLKENNSMFTESRLAKLEEERLQKEKELLWLETQNKQKSLQELIVQSQREAEEKKALEEKMKQELAEKAKEKARAKAKAKAKAKSKTKAKNSSKNESLAKGSLEKRWGTVFAKHVPNFIKKYESEIGRDNVKGCARDIVKWLSDKEIAKDPSKVPPPDFENAKLKKIKDFTKTYMEKFLTKYRAKHQRSPDDDQDDEHKSKKLKH